MLRPFACCGLLFGVVKLLTNNSQHFFCSVIAEAKCNNVGSVFAVLPTLLDHARAPHMVSMYSSHDALKVPTFANNVGSYCISLHATLLTLTQQLPTSLAQQCWEWLRPFALILLSFIH